MAKPTKTNKVIARSGAWLRVRAETTPKGRATEIMRAKLRTLMRSVIGSASWIMPLVTLPCSSVVCQNTGRWWLANEVPKSSVPMRLSHKPYCTITGLSRLYNSRSFCLDSSLAFGLKLASDAVMSPGAKCMMKKEIKLMPTSKGTIQNNRLSRYLIMSIARLSRSDASAPEYTIHENYVRCQQVGQDYQCLWCVYE